MQFNRNHNLIVLKRENYIEFFKQNQKHISDVLAKGAEDKTAEFTVFLQNFTPEITFKTWKAKHSFNVNYNDYFELEILNPAKVQFSKIYKR